MSLSGGDVEWEPPPMPGKDVESDQEEGSENAGSVSSSEACQESVRVGVRVRVV